MTRTMDIRQNNKSNSSNNIIFIPIRVAINSGVSCQKFKSNIMMTCKPSQKLDAIILSPQ